MSAVPVSAPDLAAAAPAGYRSILARPGVLRLLAFAVLARVPQAGAAVVLTVWVVSGLGRGYGAAGLVASVSTVGMALSSPVLGRALDRIGLRRTLVPALLVETASWLAMPLLDYRGLLVAAFAGGLFAVPIFTVVRQSLAVLVPLPQQKAAYALDSIGTEVTFMIGPAAGVLLATQWSAGGTLLAVGASGAVAAVGLMLLDPPTRSPIPAEPAEPVDSVDAVDSVGAGADPPTGSSGTWALLLDPRMVAALAAAVVAVAVLAGTDVSVVAHAREHHQVGLTWLVFVAWSVSSMAGGIVYGATRRSVPLYGILLGLGLLTIPVGLAPGVGWLVLAIVPAGFLCAPALSATATVVSQIVPEQRRGEAMGWYGSALTLGGSAGTPLAGFAIDRAGPWAGFALLGALGACVALVGVLLISFTTDRPSPSGLGAPSGVSPTRRQATKIRGST